MTPIFPWVNNFAFSCHLRPRSWDFCQISSFYSMQCSFRFHSLRCSEILVSPSICTKIRTWRFHRSEEVSNNFSVSWHITHISMAISANLGRDTDHNSTKLVCSHPLGSARFAKVTIQWVYRFTEWNFLTNKEKACQFREYVWVGGGGKKRDCLTTKVVCGEKAPQWGDLWLASQRESQLIFFFAPGSRNLCALRRGCCVCSN